MQNHPNWHFSLFCVSTFTYNAVSIHRERVLRLFKDINIDSLLLSLAQSRFPMRFTLCCSWSQKLWKCMRRNHVLAEYFLSLRFFLLFFVVRRRFIFIRWNASHKLLYTVTNEGFKTNVSWYIFFFGISVVAFVNFVYTACISCLLKFRLNTIHNSACLNFI